MLRGHFVAYLSVDIARAGVHGISDRVPGPRLDPVVSVETAEGLRLGHRIVFGRVRQSHLHYDPREDLSKTRLQAHAMGSVRAATYTYIR